MSIDPKALNEAAKIYHDGSYCGYAAKHLKAIITAYEAAKVAGQPCVGVNKAALDQASAARKKFRSDTPTTLYSIEGEDAVFIAAYLEAVSADQPVDRSAFEAWAKFHEYPLIHVGDHYHESETQCAYHGWQGALAMKREAAQPGDCFEEFEANYFKRHGHKPPRALNRKNPVTGEWEASPDRYCNTAKWEYEGWKAARANMRESGWVSVEDKLPPYQTKVMAWWRPIDDNPWAEAFVIADRCYVERPHADDGQGAYEQGCWFANGRYYPAFHITHWMLLPEIPADSQKAAELSKRNEIEGERK